MAKTGKKAKKAQKEKNTAEQDEDSWSRKWLRVMLRAVPCYPSAGPEADAMPLIEREDKQEEEIEEEEIQEMDDPSEEKPTFLQRLDQGLGNAVSYVRSLHLPVSTKKLNKRIDKIRAERIALEEQRDALHRQLRDMQWNAVQLGQRKDRNAAVNQLRKSQALKPKIQRLEGIIQRYISVETDLETALDTKKMMSTIESDVKLLKRLTGESSRDKVTDVMDSLHDANQDANDLTFILNEPMGTDTNDDMMEEELDQLMAEFLLPAEPTRKPAPKEETKPQEPVATSPQRVEPLPQVHETVHEKPSRKSEKQHA